MVRSSKSCAWALQNHPHELRILFDNKIQWTSGQGLTPVFIDDHGVTKTSGMVAVAVHQYHVEKEHHVGFCNDRIAMIKHGPIHPVG